MEYFYQLTKNERGATCIDTNDIYIIYIIHRRFCKCIQQLSQNGGTGQGIRLSKADLKTLSLEVNDVVDIIIIDNQLTIKKHIEPKTIKEIFKNYNRLTFTHREQK